jgi:hypothetical protein
VTRGGIGNVQNRNANLALYLLSIFVCSGAADDDKIRAASFKRLSSSDEYGHCVVPAILPFQGVDLREFDRVEQAASGMNATQPVRRGNYISGGKSERACNSDNTRVYRRGTSL